MLTISMLSFEVSRSKGLGVLLRVLLRRGVAEFMSTGFKT